MARKEHLRNTTGGGPVCKKGRIGAALHGEHITAPYAEFVAAPAAIQCARCKASSLFAFLSRQAAKAEAAEADKWEPEAPDAWKEQDDKLIAARRAKLNK